MKQVYKHRYKAMIFDLDGTLADTIEDLIDAVNKALTDHQLPTHSYEEGRKLIGRGVRNLMIRALPADHPKDDAFVDDITDLMMSYYNRQCVNHTKAYPGIEDLLRYLTYQKIPFAVVTNKPDDAAKYVIEKLFFHWPFKIIVGQSERFPRKPDPTALFYVMEQLGVEPQDCIYVGDSSVDYQTAKNAGVLPVLSLWGYGDDKILKSFDDAIWIKNPLRAIDALKYGWDMYDIFHENKEDEFER